MKLKLLIAIVNFLVLAAGVESQAQTLADLDTKYGPPVKSYIIQPDILMTAKYAEDGQMCTMYVERRRVSDKGLDLRLKFSEGEVTKLIEELVPANERKTKGKADGLLRITGGLAERFYDYENVSVVLAEVASPDAYNGGSILIIRWKHRPCK